MHAKLQTINYLICKMLYLWHTGTRGIDMKWLADKLKKYGV